MLCFHIGLPKTATTFLQWEVLPLLEGTTLIHKDQGDARARKYLRAIKAHCRTGTRRTWPKRLWRSWPVRQRLRDPSGVLLTAENISMVPDAVWTGVGPGPTEIAARLAVEAADLGVPARRVKILFGLRAQAPWLASRYAESAKDNPNFDQADFEQRIAAIADGTARAAPIDWLDYAHAYDVLADVFGANNLLFLPLEAVKEMTAAECAAHVAAFLGLPGASTDAPPPPDGARHNVRARAEGGWRLKSGAGHIELTPEMIAAIRARFAAANAGLHARTGIVLP